MKSVFLFILLSSLSGFVFADKNANSLKGKVGTEHNFEDKLVNGQYQYPDEATATVDDEKTLDDLVGIRKNFKDRLQQSAERR